MEVRPERGRRGLVLGGVAIDGANAWRVQNQLQTAADASALGAAANLPDEALAREIALTLAERNLRAGVLRPDDVVFGQLNDDTGAFEPNASPAAAVQVNAERTSRRENAVATYLLKLVGTESWDVPASATARTNESPNGGSVAGCENGTFLSESSVQTGGGNTFLGPVCIHGETGVATGGNDHFDPEVRISAPHEDMIRIYSPRAGSARPEDISVVRSMEPRLLPIIEDLYAAL